jgi:hypothetical protein
MTAVPARAVRMADAALIYVFDGVPLFPVNPMTKAPLVKGAFKSASSDLSCVEAWWSDHPNAMLGLPTGGPSGVWALDVDAKSGGLAALAELCKRHGDPLPTAVRSRTAGGGQHFFFRFRPGVPIGTRAGDIAPGIDTRGGRACGRSTGYVVAPPSINAAGKSYVWLRGNLNAVQDAPDWLLYLATFSASKRKRLAAVGITGPEGFAGAPPEQWHAIADEKIGRKRATVANPADWIEDDRQAARRYCDAGVADECAKVAAATEGQRDNTINTAAITIAGLVKGLADIGVDAAENYEAKLLEAAAALGGEEWVEIAREKFERVYDVADARNLDHLRRDPARDFADIMVDDHDHAEVEPIADGPIEWPKLKENRKPISCADNLAVLLQRLRIVLRHNEFTGRKTIRVNRHEGELNDAGLHWLLDQVRQAQLPMTQKDITAFVDVLARRSTHHPVRDYLDGLRWDGTRRIGTMASRYFGAADKPIVREFMTRWMLAAVTRVYRPGAKFDAILVLEGRQGIGKSRALATLAGGEWFTDQVALGADAKAMIESTQGKWICEIPELRSVGREADRIKAQLSATADRARLAYAQLTSEVPRQFVLAATSNPSEYLSDPTGNRRFWPIECQRVDLAGLAADRDQLWAEVVAMFRAGETCDLAPKWWSDAAAEQKAREVVSPIEERLVALLDGIEGRVLGSDIWIALGLKDLTEQKRHGHEVGAIMKKLGWERTQKRIDGEPKYIYRRGSSSKLIRFGFDGFKEVDVSLD